MHDISLIDDADYDRYEALLADYLAGRIPDATFVAERLQLGIYGQRQEGMCMVRTKIPGGRLPVANLPGYAEALERHSRHDVVHLTTRQDIQFHHVPLEDTARLQRDLGRLGIASRGAGGNTVRNVTACPLAGICPAERVDAGEVAAQIGAYFVRNPFTQSLPRKFKIAVSGCGADCAQSVANDLGVIAESRDGRNGFRLLVGGGLGANPRLPVVLDQFVDEADLLPSIEAVVAIHNRHSDRARKTRSRIKFLVERFGVEGIGERYRNEASRTRSAFEPAHAPRNEWRTPTAPPLFAPGAPRRPISQRQEGLVAVPVQVPHGDLTAAQLRALHALLAGAGFSELRVTVDQNFVIPHVGSEQLPGLLAGLGELGFGVPRAGDDVVACPGTATCQLGITASPSLAQQVSGGTKDLRIRINGCQNSCAQSDLADIGLYGKGKRHFGRMIPTYVLQLGGGIATLGADGPEIPALRVPEAVGRLCRAYEASGVEGFHRWVTDAAPDQLASLLGDLSEVKEGEVDELAVDHGETSLFRVTAAGTGECAGVQIDPADKLKLDLGYERNLRETFVAKHKLEEVSDILQVMVTLGARLLLLVSCRVDVDDANAVAGLDTHLRDDLLARTAFTLLEQVNHWQTNPDELALPAIIADVEQWLDEVCQLRPASRPANNAAMRAVAAEL